TAARARPSSCLSWPPGTPSESTPNVAPEKQASTTSTTASPKSVMRARMDTGLLAQGVPDAPYRVQQPRLAAGLQLRAQVPDVHVDHVAQRRAAAAPHRVQQLLPAEYLPGMAEEVVQQRELLRGQLDRPAGPAHLAGTRVERQVAEGQNAGR